MRDLWPRWSPDGALLAFFSRRDTEGEVDELYTVDVASGQIRRVMHSPGLDFCPTWAPDRHRL